MAAENDPIRQSDDDHCDIEELLPWYVTGQLDGVDTARVNAHLPNCLQCSLLLDEEHQLRETIAALQIGPEHTTTDSVRRIVTPFRAKRKEAQPRILLAGKVQWYKTAKWLVAAQAAIVVFAVLSMRPETPAPGAYRGLGATPITSSGNVIAIFQPDATVRDLSETLNTAGATIVDGPTSTNAYILRVPDAERARRLTILRRQPSVVMAEAITGPDQP